jgi:toxin ParE1/3/4
VTPYEVVFLAAAIDDLEALFTYIANESTPEIADRYLARLESLCLSLRTLPNRGTQIPGRISGLRRMGFERRATILFRVGENKVEILRILYGGRDLSPALTEILTR